MLIISEHFCSYVDNQSLSRCMDGQNNGNHSFSHSNKMILNIGLVCFNCLRVLLHSYFRAKERALLAHY